MTQSFRGNGKLLLTGEYFVLDGVAGLAVPTRFGQTLTLSDGMGAGLSWEARSEDGVCWFRAEFEPKQWARPQVQSEDVRARICQLLSVAEALNPGCTARLEGKKVVTRLEFDRRWGLGTSSTLVACLAQLLEVDPYLLLDQTFGGSGYDLACAVNDTPILYEREGPKVTPLDWSPAWVHDTVFVYRNQKQNSREGIRRYRELAVSDAVKAEVGELSLALLSGTPHLRAAARILQRHERIVSETIGLPTVQDELFPDFPGQLKSLGAWGGDFFWALSEDGPEKMRTYFNRKGFGTVVKWKDMVL